MLTGEERMNCTASKIFRDFIAARGLNMSRQRTLDDILIARSVRTEAMDLIEHNFRTIVSVNSAALFLSVAGVMPPVFAATLHNLSTIVVGLQALEPLKKSIHPPHALN